MRYLIHIVFTIPLTAILLDNGCFSKLPINGSCQDDPSANCSDPEVLQFICRHGDTLNFCKKSCDQCASNSSGSSSLPPTGPCGDDPSENCSDPELLAFICSHEITAEIYCARSCGLCPPPCEDDPKENCSDPKLLSFICADHALASTFCKKSCGQCPGTCEDSQSESCTNPKLLSFICGHQLTAERYCKRSCGLCPALVPCEDDPMVNCSHQNILNFVCQYPVVAHRYCERSCGLCPKKTSHSVVSLSPTTMTSAQTSRTTSSLTMISTSPMAVVTSPAPSTTSVLPATPTKCFECTSPIELCEQLYVSTMCSPPNNYCLNHIENHADGSRSLNRSCADFSTCYKDWFQGSSDNDKCLRYDGNNVVTLAFDCTFCCTEDNCNEPLRPRTDTLLRP